MKICKNCNSTFDVSDKRRNYCSLKCSIDGRRKGINSHRREYLKKYYPKNKEKFHKWFRNYYNKNREKLLLKSREYHKKNRISLLKKQSENYKEKRPLWRLK
jgi:hypothetical protein